MKFLSVYRSVEKNRPPSPAEMERMGKLVEEGLKSGKLLATEGCLPSVFGARIRQEAGNVSVTDGPFSEAKEVIGGFAIIQAASKAEAIEYVREFLSVVGEGECELRQVYDADAAPCMNQDKAANA
ncbi:MAG TPA: YciI family protein [Candidatus Dormibacteraeota bacterium]|jgi:hypothetical protein|nr:YciI family protein [Candidatus Dormibacteraeota bacterium]